MANTGSAISHLGIQQGLSNNSVQCIYQDHNGLMWFGTYDGLNSYDGYGFRVYRNKINDTGSIPHNYIYTIHEDRSNNLWVGTGQGVAVYNRIFDRFSPVYFHPTYAMTQRERITCSINTIKSDGTGNVYMGTNGWGLFLKKQNEDAAVQIPVKMPAKETYWYNVQAVYVDNTDKVWLFIETVGLCYFDRGNNSIRAVNDALRSVITMEVDTTGSIWMGTDDGLYQYDIAGNRIVKHYKEGAGQLSTNKAVSLCSDAHNNLWIGTQGGGVNILNKLTGTFQYLMPGESRHQLSSESVYSVLVDKENRIWMGTLKGGIDILDVHKSRFQTITHNPFDDNSLINNFVSAFYEDRQGGLWIGTDGGGLSIWDRPNNRFANYHHQPGNARSLSSNSVSCIKEDHLGNMWIATFGAGINRFNRATGSFEHYRCVNEQGEENKSVCLLYEDRDQNMWATTFGNGKLYRLNRTQNRWEQFDPKLNDLIAITEDHAGALWVGNARQLIRINKQTKEHLYYETGKPVRSIFEDSHHNLWVGTEGGGLLLFNRAKGNVAVRYSTADGLTNNAVLNILEDKNGFLWISTFNGVSKFDPVKKVFRNFYQSDGLQSNQFSYNAALRLQSGELALGGINGFNLFDPQQVNTRSFMPAILFSGIWVNNKPLSEMPGCIVRAGSDRIDELRVPYNEATLSFHFTALEYSSPEKVKYAYFLQGWDKDWNYPGNAPRGGGGAINYNNISEGTYLLRVRSTNAEGVWNKQEATIKIIVLPPWYRTWWAYALYIIIASALIYMYYRYKTRQRELEYEIKLAHIDAEKEKEINDKRHSFFTNISHEFRTPLTLIINPIKDLLRKGGNTDSEKDLSIVYRNARRLLSLVDQLLIFRKADVEADKMTFAKHNFYNLCNEVYLCFVQQARSSHLNYVFHCDNNDMELYVDREKMEIVLYNLISNAIKFTPPGGAISFTVKELDNTVELQVQDTGCGIPADAQARLFEKFYQAPSLRAPLKPGFGIGLYLVKHFIEAHKGSVTFESTEGAGTTFRISLYKGKAHLANETILDEAQKEPVILEELLEEPALEEQPAGENKPEVAVTDRHSVLIADDDKSIRQYLQQMLKDKYDVMEAVDGQEALTMVQTRFPDLVISDIRMDGMDGIELCRKIKKDSALNHIPVVLLTASRGAETELQSIEEGADLYITKPFDKDLLLARVENIFKTRAELRNYFFSEITLKQNSLKVSAEYREFLENCIAIVERHLTDEKFTIKVLVKEMGMSHSNLYKKIRLLSGQSITNFIRYIRLRRAAELMLKGEHNVNQAAFEVGISDIKYFRTQFNKLFGMNPSEYIKKYRSSFNNQFNVKREG
ncbi:hybrid sensor histidine kinase/response regulator transcription factor [Niastella populi]|uniref:hybrid sensor histidine kinase/response regulator transcription factor n=1 Tax=Niastella populi TaxID=550983 RepID=UPI0013FE2A4B|nr:two-component regulator propeller domain-containing protein [Niastella populi]